MNTKEYIKLALNQIKSTEDIIRECVRQTLISTMKLEENIDYYVDEKTGLVVLTAEYHKKRGYCCGNGCRECPYYPRHVRGNTELKIVDDPNKPQLLSIS